MLLLRQFVPRKCGNRIIGGCHCNDKSKRGFAEADRPQVRRTEQRVHYLK